MSSKEAKVTEMEASVSNSESKSSCLTMQMKEEVETMIEESEARLTEALVCAIEKLGSHISEVAKGLIHLGDVSENLKQQVLQVGNEADMNASRISDVVSEVENIQMEQDSMEEKLEQLAKDAEQGKKVTGNSRVMDTCETGIFISGIQSLKEYYKLNPSMDPSRVVGKLMQEIGCYSAIHNIFVADKTVDAAMRKNARAVILYLTSPYHKKEVSIRLKKYLSDRRQLRVTVSDCFPAEEASKVNALNRLAYDRRQDKTFPRTRVINRRGQAVLQSARKKGDSYKDVKIDEDELQPYYQELRQKRDSNRTNNKGKESNSRQEREYRDQQKAEERHQRAKNDQQQILPMPIPSGNNNQPQQQLQAVTSNVCGGLGQQQQHQTQCLQINQQEQLIPAGGNCNNSMLPQQQQQLYGGLNNISGNSGQQQHPQHPHQQQQQTDIFNFDSGLGQQQQHQPQPQYLQINQPGHPMPAGGNSNISMVPQQQQLHGGFNNISYGSGQQQHHHHLHQQQQSHLPNNNIHMWSQGHIQPTGFQSVTVNPIVQGIPNMRGYVNVPSHVMAAYMQMNFQQQMAAAHYNQQQQQQHLMNSQADSCSSSCSSTREDD